MTLLALPREKTPARPALRFHGGKWRMAKWIIAHFPPHRTYVEPYGGAASVLLQKPRCYAEVYNDQWEEVVSLFRMLQPRELAAAHSFPKDYDFAGTRDDIVKQIGNSVPICTARALGAAAMEWTQ